MLTVGHAAKTEPEGRQDRGMSKVDVLFTAGPVTDCMAALDWYGRLFGRVAT
jgi:hypothetical protein